MFVLASALQFVDEIVEAMPSVVASPLLLLLLVSCASVCSVRLSPRAIRRPGSMRARLGQAALMADDKDAGLFE